MGVKFFNNLELEQASHVQFKTAAGANAGKIEQSGDDLLLTNATGDILLGSGSADVNIGDGTNNVDIRFEQSMAIFADSSSTRTLTLGGLNTNVVVESPTLNTPTIASAATIDTTLTFTGANSFIMFDYEPPSDTGMYTNPVPLLKIDRNGSPQTILQRDSEMGALTLGIDDTVAICAGDTRTNVRANVNFVAEQVILAAEGGFFAFGFPNNDTTWSNRNTFRFRSDSTTASENGLYLGDSSNGTIFMDVNRNMYNIGTLAVTGDATFTNGVYVNHNDGIQLAASGNASTTRTFLTSFNNGGNSRMKIKGGNFIHTVAFETSKNDFEYAELISSYNGSDSKLTLKKSNSDTTSTASTVVLNTGVTMLINLTASGGTVLLTNLPTSDPNNAGQLWNDSGTLKISAG